MNDFSLSFKINSCSGGDTHRSYHVKCDGLIEGQQSVFVKVNDKSKKSVLKSEFESLELFSSRRILFYPKPLLFKSDQSNSYLVMSYYDLSPIDKISAAKLGESLAQQHQVTTEKHGLGRDNYIGITPQHNTLNNKWIDFYREQRLTYQLELAIRNGLNAELIKQTQHVIGSLENYFVGYDPEPSLLHGDLWSGNVGFDQTSVKPLLYDPAPYYGDRETDIAMTELFGRFPESFYQAYHQAYPLHQDYEKRRPLYNLYHALNHFNIFGGSYSNMVTTFLQQL